MTFPDPNPLERRVTRWVCPFCHRGFSKIGYATSHIAQCWKNPEQRSCGSCAHYDPGAVGGYEESGWDPFCEVGADMRAGVEEGVTTIRIVRGCPAWQAIAGS